MPVSFDHVERLLKDAYPGTIFQQGEPRSCKALLLPYVDRQSLELCWSSTEGSLLNRITQDQIDHVVIYEDANTEWSLLPELASFQPFRRVLTAFHYSIFLLLRLRKGVPQLLVDVVVDISDLSDKDEMVRQYREEYAVERPSNLSLMLLAGEGRFLGQLSSTPGGAPEMLNACADVIRQSFAAQFIQDKGAKHEAFNVAGPYVAAVGLDAAAGEALVDNDAGKRALLEYVKVLYTTTCSAGPWYSDGQFRESFGDAVSELEILLLDDQKDDGWEVIVKHALPAAARPYVKAFERPEGLILRMDEVVNRVGEGNVGEQPKRRSWPLRSALTLSTGKYEVLLLDLRLFARDPTGANELAFFRKVLDRFQAFGLCHMEQGRGISRDQWDRIDRWLTELQTKKSLLSSWRAHAVYLEALTLLPRLIASLDDLYPVILFTSSRQAAIAEELRHFPSIYTRFKKPAWGDYLESDQPRALGAEFAGAMTHAARYIRSRAHVARVVANASPDGSRSSALPKAAGDHYVEVFFDESGTTGERYVQAAMIVVYNGDEQVADALNDRLRVMTVDLEGNDGNLIQKRFSWSDGDLNYRLTKKLTFDGREAYTTLTHRNTIRLFSVLAGESAVSLCVGVTLTADKPDHRENVRDDDTGIDPTAFDLLCDTTEIALFDIIPALVTGTAQVGLRYATRSVPCDEMDVRERFIQRFGFDEKKDCVRTSVGGRSHLWGIKTVVSRTGHAFYEIARRRRAQQVDRPLLVRCVAERIGEGSATPGREIHNLADLVANCEQAFQARRPARDLFAPFGERGAYLADRCSINDVKRVQLAMDAQRAVHAQGLGEAWLHAIRATRTVQILRDGASSLLLRNVSLTLPKLSTSDVEFIVRSPVV